MALMSHPLLPTSVYEQIGKKEEQNIAIVLALDDCQKQNYCL